MANYTTFEREFLVGAYLLVERTGREIVGARDILTAFNLEPRPNWVRRAIQSYTDNGYSRGRMTMGDELDQHVYLSADGVKEAEHLIDQGMVSTADLEQVPPTDLPSPDGARIIDVAEAEVVPASDRIVRMDHNSAAYITAVEQTDALADALARGNDVGKMSHEEVAVAAAEVESLRRELQGNAVRATAFWHRATSVLGWIGREAAGAVVGSLAIAALVALAALHGFSMPL